MVLVVTVDYIGKHYSVISFSSILYSITRRAMLWLYLRSDNFQSVMIVLSTRQKEIKKKIKIWFTIIVISLKGYY